MTALWTYEDVAAATRGTLTGGPWEAQGISIDSRTISPGDIYVAIAGERFDGHTFINQALAAGAVAAIVSYRPGDVAEDAPLVTVYDTLKALEGLAAAARHRCNARIIALTGSVGKTGSKEMLGRALAKFGKIHLSQGNLNNHIGAPLSLARLPQDADFAVFELGMNHSGEISPLSRLVRPELALITNVEPVHIEFFDGIDDIARAKAEIYDGMGKGGIAVLNKDNGSYDILADAASEAGIDNIITFGRGDGVAMRLTDHEIGSEGSTVRVEFSGECLTYSLGAVGEHWAFNSAGVLACISALGLDVEIASRAIGDIKASRGRGEASTLALKNGGSLDLIDESYNASPPAVRAAFKVLALRTPQPDGGKVVVLGDMLELGEKSDELHQALLDDLLAASPTSVYAIGPKMKGLFDLLPGNLQSGWAETSAELAEQIANSLSSGDIVLVKGSLGMKMATVISAIQALSGASKRAVNGH